MPASSGLNTHAPIDSERRMGVGVEESVRGGEQGGGGGRAVCVGGGEESVCVCVWGGEGTQRRDKY